MGYLTLDATQSSLLFQVIGKPVRAIWRPCSPTTRASPNGGQIFGGDAELASAVLDRLLHKRTVVNISGDSYRLKERRQAKAE